MPDLPYLLLLGCTVVGIVIGRLLAQLKLLQMTAALDKQQALHTTELNTLEHAHQQLKDHFATLSQSALKENREAFLQFAEQSLKQQQLTAQNELEKHDRSLANIVSPIQETLRKTEQQLKEIEKERQQAYGALKQQLSAMVETQAQLHTETHSLVAALRRPQLRGQWGEITLKRLVELAGMVEYCDFFEQVGTSSESGLSRPDMIVRMPDQRELIIDAKTPLDAYLDATQAKTKETERAALSLHARTVRKRVRELANKKYWEQFQQAPDYVVLFIPGDQFLAAALDIDKDILEYALQHQIILATPTSLIALLRAVAFGWRQQAVTENTALIQQLGKELYDRLGNFIEHFSRVGETLDKAVTAYNRATGSLERKVLPGARKFTELGIEEKKSLQTLNKIEMPARKIDTRREPTLNKTSNNELDAPER